VDCDFECLSFSQICNLDAILKQHFEANPPAGVPKLIRDVPPRFILGPSRYNDSLLESQTFDLGDRVLFALNYGLIPFGFTGTVVGKSSKFPRLEIFFDEPISAGTNLEGRCPPNRGAIISTSALLNLTKKQLPEERMRPSAPVFQPRPFVSIPLETLFSSVPDHVPTQLPRPFSIPDHAPLEGDSSLDAPLSSTNSSESDSLAFPPPSPRSQTVSLLELLKIKSQKGPSSPRKEHPPSVSSEQGAAHSPPQEPILPSQHEPTPDFREKARADLLALLGRSLQGDSPNPWGQGQGQGHGKGQGQPQSPGISPSQLDDAEYPSLQQSVQQQEGKKRKKLLTPNLTWKATGN